MRQGLVHRRWRAGAAAVIGCMVLAIAGCRDVAAPGKRTGITVLSGGSGTDTAGVVLPQPLVIEVRDSTGRVREGVTVRFEAGWAARPGGSSEVPTAYIGLFSSGTRDSHAEAVTDASGRVVMGVKLGDVATTATIAIEVPAFGFVEHVSYTVRPGAVFHVGVAPSDTAVYAGASYTLRVTVVDRGGNPIPYGSVRPDAPAVATVSGTTLTGRAAGRTEMVVTVAGMSRPSSSFVSVVPRGTLLAAGADGVYAFGLDGSGFRRVVAVQGVRALRWFPDGRHFVFNRDHRQSWVSDMEGNVRPLLPVPPARFQEVTPHPSRDGQWVYVAAIIDGRRAALYRVRPDGTGLQLAPGAPPPDSNTVWSPWYPSPSPEGERLVYTITPGGGLPILDMRTGRHESARVGGRSAEWSHGDSIAYVDAVQEVFQGPLRLMSSTGGGHRRVGTGTYNLGLDWSPDDQYIAGCSGGRLEVIQVSTGVRMPLPFTDGLCQPSWKP